MSKKNQRHIECEEGSGNVFADLGLEGHGMLCPSPISQRGMLQA
jgi:hypothetical protein